MVYGSENGTSSILDSQNLHIVQKEPESKAIEVEKECWFFRITDFFKSLFEGVIDYFI